MRKKNLWLKKIMAAALCAAMAAEPAVIYAEEFSSEFYSEDTEQENLDEDYQEQEAEGEDVQTTPETALPQEENSSQETSENQEEQKMNEEGMLLDEDGFESGTEEDAAEEFFSEDFGETDSFTDAEADVLSGTCGEGVTWSLKDGVMTIEGNGAMDNFVVTVDGSGNVIEASTHRQPWEAYASQINEVYIKDGITTVGNRAFADCFSLNKVVIGNSVKTIGEFAFVNDKSLTDLTIGNSVETIEDDGLYGIGVTHLVLPASLKTISPFGLAGLWEIEEIEIPDNGIFKSIDGALYIDQGKSLYMYPPKRAGEYTIPSNVETITSGSFSYTHLTKIVIPDTVKNIQSGAFSFTDYLQSITFGKGITEIPDSCCYSDKALSEVIIPEGITQIGSGAFWFCPSLENVTVPSSVTDMENCFSSNTNVTVLNPDFQQREDGKSYVNGVSVKVTATERYDYAFEVLDLVNQERAKNGLNALTMDASLLDTAMLRGFENILYWDHTRPAGDKCFTANNLMAAENIASGQPNPEWVMDSWMNSDGHRRNILTPSYTTIGIGCVIKNGYIYWVQCFGATGSGNADKSSYSNRTNTRTVLVKKDSKYYKGSFSVKKNTLKVGETSTISNLWDGEDIGDSGAIAESSDLSVCTVNNGKITAKAEGTTIITMYYPGYKEKAVTQKITVTKENTSSKKYKVTFNANGGSTTTASKSVKAKDAVGALPKATRAKYTFDGWYTKKSGGTKVTTATKVTKSCTYYAHWKKVTVSKGAVTKLINQKGRKLNISLKNISGTAGYQVSYATNSKFSGAKKKNTSKTSLTLSGLKKNKTYYVKVRAYKKDSKGKKVYGSYSAVKKIKIKK